MKQLSTVFSLAVIAASILAAEKAQAALVSASGWDGAGTGLQTKLNPLVTPGTVGIDPWNPGTLSGSDFINGTVQTGPSPYDILWNLAGPGASATIVLEIAGNAGANTFGFYDSSAPGTKAQLFNGGASSGNKIYVKFNGTQLQTSATGLSGSFATLLNFGSTTFGMYLQGPGGTFYSDPALNGGNDNLVAYQGFGNTSTGRKLNVNGTPTAWDANSYVLGWEDLVLSSSDQDYQDMVLLVSQVTPVPETTTVIAGALLLLPLAASTVRILRNRRGT